MTDHTMNDLQALYEQDVKELKILDQLVSIQEKMIKLQEEQLCVYENMIHKQDEIISSLKNANLLCSVNSYIDKIDRL